VRGTLTSRERGCGKEGCHCIEGKKHKSLYLIASRKGKYQQLYIPDSLKNDVRRSIASFEEIRKLLDLVNEMNWERIKQRDI
jgi:hypothetical protein